MPEKSYEELDDATLKTLIQSFFHFSETRGKEASGLAIQTNEQLSVLKMPITASKFIQHPQYHELFKHVFKRYHAHPRSFLSLIGHTRLVTNGQGHFNQNNQPVLRGDWVAIHNGIIVNDEAILKKHHLERTSQIDTEAFLALLDLYFKKTSSYEWALQKTFQEIEGTASLALMHRKMPCLCLGTNNGSLYVMHNPSFGLIFASEYIILKNILKTSKVLQSNFKESDIHPIAANQAWLIQLFDIQHDIISLLPQENQEPEIFPIFMKPLRSIALENVSPKTIHDGIELKRCSRCILPETMPFISFDEKGVCNYCQNHTSATYQGMDALEKELSKYRKKKGDHDCIVAFSGGRDSSYGLHLLKKKWGMNPIAFTYDWGMVTDLGRRNQSRMCAKLGIEHVFISADIQQKRHNIRKNIEAWLRKPELGMVPLLMAGDKQFFYHANRLQKDLGSNLVVFFMNPLEKTKFKTGFCKVDELNGYAVTLPFRKTLQLGFYYLRQLLKNPKYLNGSLFDSLDAFVSTYFLDKNYLQPFEYIPWDENAINQTLISEYHWETDPNCHTTWRIGDGTAAFYNYIYYTMAGLTENDTFRSNQIREHLLTRDDALKLVAKDNQPRWDSMKWYASVIGFNLDEAIQIINNAPKIYSV